MSSWVVAATKGIAVHQGCQHVHQPNASRHTVAYNPLQAVASLGVICRWTCTAIAGTKGALAMMQIPAINPQQVGLT